MIHKMVRLAKAVVSGVCVAACKELVSAKFVDKTSEWAFTKDDALKILGVGTDWKEFAKWHLATDKTKEAQTLEYYLYPIGKNGKVYRSAIIAIREAAAQAGDDAVFDSAGHALDHIDGTQNYSGKKSLPMEQRAWAKFDLDEKGVTETDTHYMMSGIATTPSPDRMEDVVEPMGAEYELPLPLLWQHDSDQPIGEVVEAKPNKNGIPVKFQIPKILEPGRLKDRLDEAVQSIKHKLVKGLSIGFSPIEYSYMEDTGGYRFMRWSWLELSAVTIPANAEASIANIKSFGGKQNELAQRKMVTLKNPEEYRERDPMTITPHENLNPMEKMVKGSKSGARESIDSELAGRVAAQDAAMRKRGKQGF